MGKNHIERILYIDRLLRENAYPSRREIAETFEVSIKTVERDLEYMRDRLGAPLEYDREQCGYYYEEEGFYLPALYMGEGDALALFLSHHVGSAWRGTPLAESAQKAWERLRRLLPQEVAIPPAVFSEYVVLIDRSVSYTAEHWLTLLNGARARCKVVVDYRTPGHTAVVRRTLHPYRLIHHRNAWYLLAFDEFREEVRIDDYIDPDFGVFNEREWFTARLRAQRWMADILGEHLEAASFTRDDAGNGMVEISWRTNQHEELKHWVLQWGDHVVVVEPRSLTKELSKIGRFYEKMYGPDSDD